MSSKAQLQQNEQNQQGQRASGSSSNNTFNGHVLPPEQEKPDEPPPPYTPSDPSSSLGYTPGPGMPPQPHPPQQQQQQQQQQQYQNRPYVPPPPPQRPPPQPQRPPPQGYPGAYSYTSQYNPGHPPPGPSRHGQYPQQNNRPGRPGPPFQYPPGYWCYKCSNTGIKHKNGKSCQDCYGRFARQGSNVQVHSSPFSMSSSLFNPFSTTTTYSFGGAPPRVVQPGDPAIGGIPCGRCRGRGTVFDLILLEDTCPVCHGVGRLFN